MPKQVRHDGDGSVVTLNNILSHQSTACCLYQHPPALKNLFVTLNNRLLPSITLPVTLNLFQGLFIIVTLNLFGGLPPILGAFYNATTFKMPKQVRHDRSVVTLNNILSHQTTACRLYRHPSCSQKSLCHPEQPLAAIDNSTCHPELVSGSVHYCHLEFVWRSTPYFRCIL